jgi:hypothetical protein
MSLGVPNRPHGEARAICIRLYFAETLARWFRC